MRRAVVLISGTLVASVGIVAPAYAEHASSVTLEPTTVVLYRSAPTEVRVRAEGFAGTPYAYAYCRYDPPRCESRGDENEELVSTGPMRQVAPDTWIGSLMFAPTELTGAWVSEYTGGPHPDDGGQDEGNLGPSLQVKRNTILGFNAAPEEVRLGEMLSLTGRLTRMTPDQGYVGYASKTLTVQFKPRGGTFANHSTVTTDSAGRFSKRVTASRDGTWRVRFAGTRHHHRETSRHDFIDVR